MSKLLMIITCTLFFIGCRDVNFDNGTVPDSALPLVRQMLGEYHGSFGDLPFTLSLSLNGNKPRVALHGINADGDSCYFQGGDILAAHFEGEEGKETLTNANFALVSQNCFQLAGQTIRLHVMKKDGRQVIEAAIFEEMRSKYVCGGLDEGMPPADPTRPDCRWVTRDFYLTGLFGK